MGRMSAEVAASGHPSASHRPMELELVGLDRPGIVREISMLLAQHEVNVEELSTDRSSAPMSGEMLFRARARVHVPASAMYLVRRYRQQSRNLYMANPLAFVVGTFRVP